MTKRFEALIASIRFMARDATASEIAKVIGVS